MSNLNPNGAETMSQSGHNFLASEIERAADAETDLVYLRYTARDVAARLAGIAAAVLDVRQPDCGELADIAIRLAEAAEDLIAAAGTK